MKSISLKTLKEDLSKYIDAASNGMYLQITKYNKPLVYIMPYQSPSLHVGSKSSGGELKSAVRRGSKGAFLSVLKADRKD